MIYSAPAPFLQLFFQNNTPPPYNTIIYKIISNRHIKRRSAQFGNFLLQLAL